MIDEGKLRKAALKGDNAQRLLDDPLVVEFFDKIEKDITDGWKLTLAGDNAARENAYIMHRLFKNFKEAFKHQIRDGDYAKKQLLNTKDSIPTIVKRKLNIV